MFCRWRTISTVLAVMAGVAGSASAQDAQAEADAESVFENEVKHLRRYATLSDAQAKALTKAMDPIVSAANKLRNRAISATYTEYGYDIVWPAMYDGLFPILRKHVPDEEEFDAFVADLRLRQQFERELAVDSAIIMLDRAIGLSRKKRESLLKTLHSLHHEGRLPSYPADDFVRFYLSRSLGKLNLTDEERASWENNSSQLESPKSDKGWDQGSTTEEKKRSIRKQLASIGEARVREIVGRVDLTTSEKAKLKLAVKGTATRLVTVRLSAIAEFRKLAAEGKEPRLDSELFQNARGSLYSLFSSPEWTTFLRASLGEAKWKQLAAMNDADWPQRIRYYAAVNCATMCWGMNLTGKQQIEFRDFLGTMMPERLEAGVRGKGFDSYKKMGKVPREKYVEFLGEENIDQFDDALKQLLSFFPDDFTDEAGGGK